MGRDHTIYALEAGYVRYYLDPERHPDRRFIGVVFDKEGRLPTPRNAPTRRRLGRVPVPIEQVRVQAGEPRVGAGGEVLGGAMGVKLRPGYMYREPNWEIGRAPERAGVKAAPYNKKNRWLAWRKRQAKAEKAAQMKSLKGKKGSKKAKGRR